MCWSGPASVALASAGTFGALYGKWKGESILRWGVILYFCGMEMLQALTYIVIDLCGLDWNTGLTVLSYLHICFQPIFTNLFAISFLPKEKQARLIKMTTPLVSIFVLLMISRLFFDDLFGSCNHMVTPLCGTDTCSYSGNWHIAWRLQLNGFDEGWFGLKLLGFNISWAMYWLPVFILPIFYGSWRWSLYHLLVGPVLAWSLTTNKDEMSAIWCLTSIGFLIATHFNPLKNWLETPIRKFEEKKNASNS